MLDFIKKLFKNETQTNQYPEESVPSENQNMSVQTDSDAISETAVDNEVSGERPNIDASSTDIQAVSADVAGKETDESHFEDISSAAETKDNNDSAKQGDKKHSHQEAISGKDALRDKQIHRANIAASGTTTQKENATAATHSWATPASMGQVHHTWADSDGSISTGGGWTSHLKEGLSKSRNRMAKSLAGIFGGGQIDDDLYEELEAILLTSDMGIEATKKLMDDVRNRVSLKGLKDGAELRQALKEAVCSLISPLEQHLRLPEKQHQPFVIMMAGINGAGKTTSIGKLAKHFQAQGKSVLLAAGDTFRAAAREQLIEWGRRNDITVISQEKGDSASVCYDALEAAKARNIDVVLADTAGRLPTQLHLMEEIKKVKRVLQKSLPDAPHEVIVVLDANIGQNALTQVRAFHEALNVTGLIVTKLDGTAKGGILAALAANYNIPVRYIGVGEGIDDLRPFDAAAFTDALLDDGNVQ